MSWILPLHWVVSLSSVLLMLGSFVIGAVYLVQEHQLKTKKVGRYFWSLPSLVSTEQGVFTWLQWGFMGLTLTIFSGGLMAYGLLGFTRSPQWGWPHWAFALTGWGVYAWSLYGRRAGWRGRRIILLSLIGFAIILLVFLQAHEHV